MREEKEQWKPQKYEGLYENIMYKMEFLSTQHWIFGILNAKSK